MRFLLLFLLLVEILGANPYKNLHTYRLSNGLEVYLLPDDKAKNVHIEVDVKVGMKVEDDSSAGLSHLVEHIVFRDQRIKDKDYYNLIQDRGATFVNGYTSYYETQYLTTINPENAYWITETFSKMLFDKNVTEEDLRVEKGALQIEIGEPNWADIFSFIKLGKFFNFIADLFPPTYDIYRNDFGIDTEKEKIEYKSAAIYKNNNKDFTLNEVLAHYHDYYYPSNMTLKIVGKFNLYKMKSLIQKSFGKVPKREGKTLIQPLYKDATLSHKPYLSYENLGMEDQSSVQLGTKLLADNPQKVLIVESYIEDLADRLNKEFRNKKGETYGVSGGIMQYENAVIASLYFSSPHDAFDKNIMIAKTWMHDETQGDINDSTIKTAIKQKLKHFEAVEHDVDSLMSTINKSQYFKRFYGDLAEKTPYTLLKEITPQMYKKVLKETFTRDNAYTVIQRDYVWFPYEGLILTFLMTILFLYLVMKFYSANVNRRNIRLQRRLTNRFTSFIIILTSIMVAELLYTWIEYALVTFVGLNPLWRESFDIPISYFIMIVEFLFSLLITYFVVKKLFSWFFTKLYVTQKSLILVGAKSRYINLKDIAYCEVTPWSAKLWGKIHGVSLLFWRPLLKIVSNQNEEIYLRSIHADHLAEDLSTVITPQPDIIKKFEV
jgi:predicted Zn-dependent peptidase